MWQRFLSYPFEDLRTAVKGWFFYGASTNQHPGPWALSYRLLSSALTSLPFSSFFTPTVFGCAAIIRIENMSGMSRWAQLDIKVTKSCLLPWKLWKTWALPQDSGDPQWSGLTFLVFVFAMVGRRWCVLQQSRAFYWLYCDIEYTGCRLFLAGLVQREEDK